MNGLYNKYGILYHKNGNKKYEGEWFCGNREGYGI